MCIYLTLYFYIFGLQNIEIKNFSTSWSDGLAFCALIHHFYPDSFDYTKLEGKNPRANFQLAFDTAEYEHLFTTVNVCVRMYFVEAHMYADVICYSLNIYINNICYFKDICEFYLLF